MNILEACLDPNLFLPFLSPSKSKVHTWNPWFTALKVVYGLPVSPSEMPLVTECTGRTKLREGDDDKVILDAVRQWKPPFSPDQVIADNEVPRRPV